MQVGPVQLTMCQSGMSYTLFLVQFDRHESVHLRSINSLSCAQQSPDRQLTSHIWDGLDTPGIHVTTSWLTQLIAAMYVRLYDSIDWCSQAYTLEKSIWKWAQMICLLFASDDVIPGKHNQTAYWVWILTTDHATTHRHDDKCSNRFLQHKRVK